MKISILIYLFVLLINRHQFFKIDAFYSSNLTETLMNKFDNKLFGLSSFLFGDKNSIKAPINLEQGTPNEISLSKKLNGFGLRIYEYMRKTNDNVFISPYSISIATLMLYFGARNETSRQMKKLMGLVGLSDEDILSLTKKQIIDLNYKDLKNGLVLQTANKLYYDEEFPIYQDYSNLLSKYFLNVPTPLNFSDTLSLVSTINDWAEKQTNGLIKELLSYDTSYDRSVLVLINAIYFKGEWANKFDPRQTVKENFYMENGNVVQVDMMKQTHVEFYFSQNPGDLPMAAYHLKYKGDRILMTILLPDDGFTLSDIEEGITQEIMYDIISNEGRRVIDDISLPKFKLEYKNELGEIYKRLGVGLMFDKNQADFSGIRDRKPLYVTQIFHKAIIEVSEEGSEAAAATIILTRAILTPNFNCNKPFMFVIHDRKNVLFMGKLVDPNRQKNMS